MCSCRPQFRYDAALGQLYMWTQTPRHVLLAVHLPNGARRGCPGHAGHCGVVWCPCCCQRHKRQWHGVRVHACMPMRAKYKSCLAVCAHGAGRHDREVEVEVVGGVLRVGVAAAGATESTAGTQSLTAGKMAGGGGGRTAPPVICRALAGPLDASAPIEVHRYVAFLQPATVAI